MVIFLKYICFTGNLEKHLSILESPYRFLSSAFCLYPFHSFLLCFSRSFYLFTMLLSFVLAALAGSATSTILWDGRFNDLTSSAELEDWSWSNEVGPYQYYIVGIFFLFPALVSKLISPARHRKCHLLRQPRFIIQEPCRHRQRPRSQDYP